MVDIHTHILPGLDDGAPDLDQSLAMLQVAAAAGTTDIAATPHANHMFAFDAEKVAAAVAALQAAAGDSVRVHRGCELHMTADNVQDALENPRKYAYNGLHYLLLELPAFAVPQSADEILSRMLDAGIAPIIAHPERNVVLQRDYGRVARWVERGALMQITAQSLLGTFGRSAKSAADQFLARGLAHIVASDAHDAERRRPSLKEACEYVARRYGSEATDYLFVENPRAALEDGAIQPLPAVRKKRWFLF